MNLREKGDLRNQHFRVEGLQFRSRLVDCLGKLDRSQEGDAIILRNVRMDRAHQVVHVDVQLHKHIQNRDLRSLDRNQTGVSVVDHKIGSEPLRRVVVHTARAVGDIAHHNHTRVREMTDDVCNGACVATVEQIRHSNTASPSGNCRHTVLACACVMR